MTPVFVYLGDEPDDEFEDVTLPTNFTCHRLDSNRDRAEAAGRDLDEIDQDLVMIHYTMSLYDRALYEAEPHSTRAKEARTNLQDALTAYENLLIALDRTRTALVSGWDIRPGRASRRA